MTIRQTHVVLTILVLGLYFSALSPALHGRSPQAEYRNAIIHDWILQERERGREIYSDEALETVVQRAETTLDWLNGESWATETLLENVKKTSKAARLYLESPEEERDLVDAFQHYLSLRDALRKLVLNDPEITGQPIVFLTEERFTWQMLHEYLSYYYNKCGMHGGSIRLLTEPGKSFATESLTEGLFPRGVFQTASLSWDGDSVYFSFADFSETQSEDSPKTNVEKLMERPYIEDFDSNYMRDLRGKFNLYKLDVASRKLEQLTHSSDDDFDPIETPDGDVVFMSTRRGGYGRCHGHYEPLNVHTLHRLNSQTKEITTLSWHETNEWQPSFLNDGRIVYTRWDYVDRAASRHHGLWTTNSDGTNSAVLFGNYTFDVNACYQGKSIPNSNKVMFVGGAHHLDVGGTLLLFDPSKMRYDPATGKDDLSSLEFLTPEVPLPETEADESCVCQQYYFSPTPLSEDTWIVSYSHDPLGGYLGGTKTSGKLGIYYGDRYGNLELLYENLDNNESALYPIPLARRQRPTLIPSSLDKNSEPLGTFVLSNVYESLFPFPKDRKVTELRIIQLLPKGPDYQSNYPPLGRPSAVNARMYLGSVPVEEDGSAYFTAPANVPLYFQAVDNTGRAVQSMRSIVYLQPGENRGCVGCHEQTQTTLTNDATKRPLASLRAPSPITPGPQDLRPISYPRFIQPILDRRCVKCHDDNGKNSTPILTGELEGSYSRSYNQLVPYLRWYEWGEASYREIVTIPGECGADISPLIEIISDNNHKDIGLTEEEKRAFYLWCDLNVPFYGVYEKNEQKRQQRGECVSEPVLQ